MVTSISINSHLPHVPFTGCRFLPFNFIAARQLRRASSLMRFCTVVRSHNSCNFLWYLRDQIFTSSDKLILYWSSELTIGLRKVFQISLAFSLWILLFFGILLSLPLTYSQELSWSAGYLQVRIAFELESLGIFFAWVDEVPLLTSGLICIPLHLWQLLVLIYQGFHLSQLSAAGSGVSGV